MKRAFITGITGQDGSYLAELLLDKGYEVHGLRRRSSTSSTSRIDHLIGTSEPQVQLHYGDLTDGQSLTRLIHEIEPDEIYNLGAQSHVRISFDQPAYTLLADGLGALHILEAARQLKRSKEVKVYQAGSSEMFGKVAEVPQKESTPFNPRSPYACAKCYAHFQTVNYRESYGLFACNGILFNHESPRRGDNFVTRKITRAVARIHLGLQEKLSLGNVDAKRDWGYAKDYVEAMWMMLQQPIADDFVIATGVVHSVRDFLSIAFGFFDMDWQNYVVHDSRLERPAEVDLMHGDSGKAQCKLGWRPKTSFSELVRLMLEHDLEIAKKELNC